VTSPGEVGASHFCKSTKLGCLRGHSRLKSGITSDFITQSKLLGGRTPQTPERISFSVGCLHAAADTFVII
ncbi:MAG: hypothetical protein ACKPA9_20930, partial [Microcystis sp.]